MGIQITGSIQPLPNSGTAGLTAEQRQQLEAARASMPQAITKLKLYEQEDADSAAKILWANTAWDTGITYQDWLAAQQTKGIDAYDVDWDLLEVNLRQAQLEGTRSLEASLELLDALASRYAVTRSRIEEIHTGAAQAQALERLDRLFAENAGSLAWQVADTYGTALERYGISGEAENLYGSLMAVYEGARDGYLAYIEQNPDYMGVRGTGDEWLMSLDGFACTALRGVVGAAPAAEAGAATYSATELRALDGLLREMDWSTHIGKSSNEEEIGFRLGNMAALVSYTNSAIGAGSAFRALSTRLLDGHVADMLWQADSKVEQLRSMPVYTVVDHSREAAINTSTVMRVYNAMLEALENGKSPQEVWRTGYDAGKASYAESRKDPLYRDTVRYGSGYETSFLPNFYEKAHAWTAVAPSSTPYPMPETGQEQLMLDWERYLTGLGAQSPFRAGVLEAYA